MPFEILVECKVIEFKLYPFARPFYAFSAYPFLRWIRRWLQLLLDIQWLLPAIMAAQNAKVLKGIISTIFIASPCLT